jgi:hypothetical protein
MQFIGRAIVCFVLAVTAYACFAFINVKYEQTMHKLQMEIVKEQSCVYGTDK